MNTAVPATIHPHPKAGIKTCLLLLALCCSCTAFSQTTNISGIVNTYHKVVEVLPGKSCLRVADPTGLNINSIVMVLQMKGALINTSNSSSFGDTSSLAGAGNYEVGTICYIIGDSVFLFHQLLNSYDVSAQVQLVQFAEYSSALVTDTVKALSWDSNTGLGGVIAIYAQEDLTLNKPIWADSSGYAGGAYIPNNGSCPVGTGFVYDASSASAANGAYKGESVAILSGTQDGGKGAQANGGGGGNNHNNSGGGGGHLTAGGNGGGNSSSGPFGCNTSGNWGRGGKALSTWNNTKIFLGGGAGAGHANNGSITQNFGGNGGGIIFLWANNLISNGQLITAKGGNGGHSQADGAGGGGAGGTIILHINNYTDPVNLSVNGGTGGTSDNGSLPGRCFGGGGGGAGGIIYFTGTSPSGTLSYSGGAGGAELNRDIGCNAAVPGVAGANGSLTVSYNFRRSTTPASYCELLLPAQLLFFNVRLNGNTALLNWQVDHPELIRYFIVEKNSGNGNWSEWKRITASDQVRDYGSTDPALQTGNTWYRLKLVEKDGRMQYSPIRKIWLPAFSGDFTLYPNPARGRITVNGLFDPAIPVQLMDITGKILLQRYFNGTRQELDLGHLAPGTYLVRYRHITRKLLIR